MDISFGEAMTMLRKWKEEKRVLSCILKFHHGISYTLGKIQELTNESVTVSSADSKLPLGEAFSATALLKGTEFDYVEGRHTPTEFPKLQGYDAILTLTFSRLGDNSAIGFAVMHSFEDMLQQ